MAVRVAIIGAGIVGASIARVLSQYSNLEVRLIDREPDVGWGVSKANTGLIHGGYDDDPDKYPVRAGLCVKGNRIWHDWVKELEVPHKWNGALIAAFNEEEVRTLEKLLERGIRNGVPEMRLVSKEEVRHLEPNISPEVTAALWIPTVGQIAPTQAVIALVENAVQNGVRTYLGTEVRAIKVVNGEVKAVVTSATTIEADIVVNAAGLYADEVSRMAGIDYFSIKPRKGEYWIFDEDAEPKPKRVLFPTPTPISKGVVVTTEVNDHLMIGPNAKDIDSKDDLGTTHEGLKEVWDKAKKLWPKLPPRSAVIRTFAGLRPEPPGGDFIIKAEKEVWGFINVAGIRSPGLTAAPAIAYEVAKIIQDDLGISLKRKEKWVARRESIKHISTLPWEQIKDTVRESPLHGRIVCRCNRVSEQEIREAVRRMKAIGVKVPSIDSVKFRTWATTGTCQGTFCRVRIALILAEEYGVDLWNVTVKGVGSEVGVGDVKVLLREGVTKR